MSNRTDPASFVWLCAVLLLTLLAATLLIAAWWLAPTLFGEAPIIRRTVVVAGVTAWLSSLIGLAPAALWAKQGLTPIMYGYFFGAAARVMICLATTAAAIKLLNLPAGPWIAVLMGMHFVLLFVEVGLIVRFVQRNYVSNSESVVRETWA